MTTKHTKTPWMIAYGGEEGDGYAVIASKFSDRPVCTIEPRDFNTANAALIVRAVNAHDAMIGALETSIGFIEEVAATNGKFIPSQAAINTMKAALRAAKGEA